ncbi:hypothetical protein [Acidianus manzaensis]|nr:hypothetical protein [Acidianus manzaensis]
MLGQLAVAMFALAIIGIFIIYSLYSFFYNDAYNSSRELEEEMTLLSVKYHPELLCYNNRYYLYFTVNSSVNVLLENITNVNGTLLFPINKQVKGFYWNLGEIPEEAKTTLLYVYYGGYNNYIVGISNLQQINVDISLSIYYKDNNTLFINAYNEGNIPEYFRYIVITYQYKVNNITKESMNTIYIYSWYLPNQGYYNSITIINATHISATLYYSDILGQGETSATTN